MSSRVRSLQFVLPASVEALRETIASAVGRYQGVCVVGGDGTINRAVNAMDLAQQKLIVLPAGRGNDFLRSLGLPRNLHRALRRLPQLSFREIDIAQAGHIRYVNSAGIGLDAQVLERMERMRAPFRHSYLLAFILSVGSLRSLKMQCQDFPRASNGPCWWLLAMNGRLIGGGIPVAPKASLTDGKIDGMAITVQSRWAMLAKLLPVLRQVHMHLPEIEYVQKDSLTVEDLAAPLPLAVDGELYTWAESRLTFRAMPRALKVLS